MSLLAHRRSAAKRSRAAAERPGRDEGSRLLPRVPTQRTGSESPGQVLGGQSLEESTEDSVRLSAQDRRYIAHLVIVDGGAASLAGIVAYLAAQARVGYGSFELMIASAVFPALWVACVAWMRAYEPRFLYVGPEEFRRVLHAALSVAVAGALCSYAFRLSLPRSYLLGLFVVVFAGTIAGRLVLRGALRRRRAAGSGWMRRVVVAGHDAEVRTVLAELARSRSHGYEAVGVCLVEESPSSAYDVPVCGGLSEIAAAVERLSADAAVVLPCHHLGPHALRRLGWDLERHGTQMLIAPGLMDVASQRATVSPAGGVALLHLEHAELTGIRRVVKEVFDRVVAAGALVLLLPVLACLMLAIRLDSPGPVLFRQERVGRGHEPFMLLKLRTMVTDAEHRRDELIDANEADGLLFKMRNDPRVTRVGRFLRRYSLDELPQLVNVLRGHMSLVGPRPPLPVEVQDYEDDVRRRMVVKPGITGLWQVSGRSDLPWDEGIRLDLRYVENWSLAMDIAILWRTWRAVVAHQGAY